MWVHGAAARMRSVAASATSGITAAASSKVCLDSGAGKNIMDVNSHRYDPNSQTATNCMLDAVGANVPVSSQADVFLPGLRSKQRSGVLVDGTPDCACLGELVIDEEHDYIWTKRTGPVLIEDQSLSFWFPPEKAIFCEAIDKVCYLPEAPARAIDPGESVELEDFVDPAVMANACKILGEELRISEEKEQAMREFLNLRAEYDELFVLAANATRDKKANDAALDELDFEEALMLEKAKNIMDEMEGKPILDVEGYDQKKTVWTRVDQGCYSYRTTKKGGPQWRDVKARTTTDARTGEVLEREVPVDFLDHDGHAILDRIRDLKTVLHLYGKDEDRPRQPSKKVGKSNLLRYENVLGGLPPPAHYLAHHPADERCKVCRDSKGTRVSATPLTEEQISEMVKDMAVLDLVDLDLCEVEPSDVHGNPWFMATQDRKSRGRRCAAHTDKSAETTWDVFSRLYPGSRLEEGRLKRFPLTVSCDNDTAFKGIFEENVRKRGGRLRRSIPYRSESNARAERNIRTCQRGGTAQLLHANGPIRFWSYALKMFCYNDFRVTQYADLDGKTGYFITHGEDFQGVCVPFGCAAHYLDDEAGKFAPRRLPGIVVGYGTEPGSFLILDQNDYEKENTLTFRISRDVQLDREDFPFRRIAKPEDCDYDSFRFKYVGANTTPTYSDELGALRCTKCHLLVTDEPVTCVVCRKKAKTDPRKRKHPAGRPSHGCLRSRCPGHVEPDDQGADLLDDEEKPVAEEMKVKESGEPGSGKKPADETKDLEMEEDGEAEGAAEGGPPPPLEEAEATQDELRERDERQLRWLRDVGAGLEGVGIFALSGRPGLYGGISRAMADARLPKPKLHRWVRTALAREQEEKNTELKCLGNLRRILGCVTRLYNQRSWEVLNDPGARASIDKELLQLQELGVFDLWDVMEHDEAARLYSNARFVRGMMITSLKNAEFLAEGGAQWKSRYVAIGCDLRDRNDERIWEDLLHVIPASLGLVRLAIGWALVIPFGICLTGDVVGAFLTSPLSGPPCFLIMAKSLWPSHWHKFRRPVTRIWTSLYGMQRGDVDWGSRARSTMIFVGCVHVMDLGEDSFYLWWPSQAEIDLGATPHAVFVVLYADDFMISGNRVAACTIHRVLCEMLGFSKSDFGYRMRTFIGLEMVELPSLADGTKRCFVHQIAYTRHLLEEYRNKFLRGGPLKMATTPGVERDDDGEVTAVSSRVPDHGDDKAHWGGQLLWLGRGARKDIMYTVKRLTSQYTTWGRAQDRALLRLLEYLNATVTLGLEFRGHEEDLPYLLVDMAVDSDLAGEKDHAKSTGGFDTVIAGPRTWIPAEWQSKTSTRTARSTPHAEMQSLDVGTFTSGIPMAYLLEVALRRLVTLVGREDNASTFLAVQRGYSKKLSYLARQDRISISALHEVYFGDPEEVGEIPQHPCNLLLKEESDKQRADIYTKILNHVKHWENVVTLLRMAFLEDVAPKT